MAGGTEGEARRKWTEPSTPHSRVLNELSGSPGYFILRPSAATDLQPWYPLPVTRDPLELLGSELGVSLQEQPVQSLAYSTRPSSSTIWSWRPQVMNSPKAW